MFMFSSSSFYFAFTLALSAFSGILYQASADFPQHTALDNSTTVRKFLLEVLKISDPISVHFAPSETPKG
jgi:hypothetical protein